MSDILCFLKTYGPTFSPIIITVSTIIAICALIIQRNLARKRATLDLFLKTETDVKTLELWDNYASGVLAFEAATDKDNFKLSSRSNYDNIRSYLHIFELIACGMDEKILDKKMCKRCFVNVFLENLVTLIDFIAIVQKEPHGQKTYCEYLSIAKKWHADELRAKRRGES
jgi:hypothetical protein